MKVEIVLKELSSVGCQEIVKELWNIVSRVQDKEITHKQGSTEIAGCKHIIQSLALDWTFNGTKDNLKKLIKK